MDLKDFAKSIATAALGGLVAVGLMASGARLGADKPIPRAADMRARIASEDQTRLESLENQVHALRGAISTAHAGSSSSAQDTREAPTSAAPKDLDPDRPNEERLAAVEAQILRSANAAEAQLAREGRDPAWSTVRASEMRTAFTTSHQEGLDLESIDCRSTLCRMVINRTGDLRLDKIATRWVDQPPFRDMGLFFRYEEDRVTVYATKEGMPFPKEEPAAPSPI